ncbi:MAG: ATP-binding cassette domain-containing protein [Methanobrevibacter sp.]|jgi:peptide/nickel transport system ATP-binding protein|nr:ATP-binding cassette domain-containing protein [Candidatus Methanovirga basalitermitum]
MAELKANNISFKYNGTNEWILKDLSISLKDSQVKGLIGESGGGKSTLCKILAGYEDYFEGEVKIDDLNTNSSKINPVQLIFQHPEKTMNPKWKMKRSLDESWEVSDDILEKFGIKENWLNRWSNELSGGELQKFSIIRALNPKTKFLIADEITTMLDAVTQVQIWKLLLSIAKKRKIGILVVSHDKELVHEVCDEIAHLNDINHV